MNFEASGFCTYVCGNSRLTCEGHVQQVVPIEHATVVVRHRGAEAFGFRAHVPLKIVQRQSERVHRVHHELNLRFLLVSRLRGQSELRRAYRAVLTGRCLADDVLPEDAAECFLPVLAEPRVPTIGLRSQRGHVLVEARDVLRLELHRDRAFGLVLEALDELDLTAPTVARQPLKRLAHVAPSGSFEDPSGVLRASEQDHSPRVRLLTQSLDDVVEHAVVRGARHFHCRRDAHVALGGFPGEHLDTVFAVAALGVNGRDVRPIRAFHHVHQRDRLERVRGHRPREVVESDEERTNVHFFNNLIINQNETLYIQASLTDN